MFLTKCAACAAELGLTLGKKCGRCSTRYCGPECQKQHWEEGGHDTLCKKIKKAGGAEQFHANQEYAEAVAVAAEECAEDTKGQKCYICLEAVHPRTGEGLVRGCACGDRDGVASGITGIAHVSCLMEQAKMLVVEAQENNFDNDRFMSRWRRWCSCSLCEQEYHGVVKCALGWACWRTYLGRPEKYAIRIMAMSLLGNGLSAAGHHGDALCVREAELSLLRRLGGSEETMLVALNNLAHTYQTLGRHETALRMRREIYSRRLQLLGNQDCQTDFAAYNFAASLAKLQRFEEAKSLMRKTMPVAQQVLGENHEDTLRLRWSYAVALCVDPAATLDDLREGVTTLEDSERIARRVFGGAHPLTTQIGLGLRESRKRLAVSEASVGNSDDVSAVRGALEAMNAT
jgi:hypothetical protein